MRFGLLEIILIIVVIIVAAVLTRILRGNRDSTRQNEETYVTVQPKSIGARTSKTRNILKRTGIAFAFAGLILLLAGIGMFRWAFQSYLWSFIVIGIGTVLIYLSRKK